MSDETRGELTLGQQRFIERMQEAQNEGVSLADYYRAHGLSMAMLYKVRHQLIGTFALQQNVSTAQALHNERTTRQRLTKINPAAFVDSLEHHRHVDLLSLAALVERSCERGERKCAEYNNERRKF